MKNIKSDTKTIISAIPDLIGNKCNDFKNLFTLITKDTLNNYIKNRRFYFASIEIRRNTEKSIVDIALDYGYSEQSSFTRAFREKYGVTPNKLRKNKGFINIVDDKYNYSDFDENIPDTRSRKIFKKYKQTGYISDPDINFLENIHLGYRENPFNINTCYTIANLADEIGVPFQDLMEVCADLYREFDDNKSLYAHELGIHSTEELKKICEHYDCNYFELSSEMVVNYYETLYENKSR